jgi:hypothetical protein
MLCGHNKRKKKKNQSKGAATFMLKAVFDCTQPQPFLLAFKHLLSCLGKSINYLSQLSDHILMEGKYCHLV